MSSTQEVGDIFGEGKGIAHAMLRSPTVLIVSIGLWGMNIFFFKLFKIDYKYVLLFDIHKLEEEYDKPLRRRQQQQSLEYSAISTGEEKKTDNPISSSLATSEGGGGVGGLGLGLAACSEDEDEQDDIDNNNKDPSGVVPTNTYYPGLENRFTSSSKTTTTTTTTTSHHQQIQPEDPPTTTITSSSSSSPTTTTTAAGIVDNNNNNDHHHHHHQNHHPHTSIDWYKLVLFSLVLLALLHIISHYWMDHLNRNVLGAVFWFYGIVGIVSMIPIPHMRWLSDATYLTLRRVFELIRPRCYVHKCGKTMQRQIPFVDVFVADAMCSLSKVFFDWGYLIHMASHYPNPVPQDIHNILVPSTFAAIPYLIRARQCLIMYTIGRRKLDPKRNQHMANAIKYSTSIYPLCLSAYQKTLNNPIDASKLEGLLILLMTINASYSLYWDIVMDWGMMQNPTAVVAHAAGCSPKSAYEKQQQQKRNHPKNKSSTSSSSSSSSPTTIATTTSKTTTTTTQPLPPPKRSSSSNLNKKYKNNNKWNLYRSCRNGFLRSKLRFGLRISLLIVVTDMILRFSWLLRFKQNTLFPSPDAFILATQFLEVFRRAIWNLLRVEWENIKQKTAKKLALLESGGNSTDEEEYVSSDDDDDDEDEFDDEYDDDGDDSEYDEEEHHLLDSTVTAADVEDGAVDPTTTTTTTKEKDGMTLPLFSSPTKNKMKGVVGLSNKMERTSPPPSPEKLENQRKQLSGGHHHRHIERQRSTSPHPSSPKQRKKGGGGSGW